MAEFVFPLKGAHCSGCSGNISYILKDEDPQPQFFTIKHVKVSPNFKKLIVEIADDQTSEEEVRRFICQKFAVDGTYELVEESAKHYWILGTIGLIVGVIILILALNNALLLWPVQCAVAIVSVGLTAILGRESLQKAHIEWQRRKLGMDSLFVLSTAVALGVSLLGLWVPGLPLMFEASLLIFGFRHIGIALKKSVYATPNLPVRYQRLLSNAQTPKNAAELHPGDKILLRAGEMLPKDGWLLPNPNALSTQSYAMDVSKVKGIYLPEMLPVGASLKAGMIAKTDCVLQIGLGHALRYFSEKPTGKPPKGQIWLYPEAQRIGVVARADTDARKVEFSLSKQDFIDEKGQSYFAEVLSALELNTVITHLDNKAHMQLSRALVQHAPAQGLLQTASYLERLEKEIEDASARAAPIQEQADNILKYFVPTVLGIALVSGLITACFFPPLMALRCVISILVSACPCTLGFVTPLVMDFARAKGKEAGVVFSQYDAVQRLSEVDTVLLDIHGTATKGKPEALIRVCDPNREQEIKTHLARLEQFSDHHVAKAIYTAVKGNEILQHTWGLKKEDITSYAGGIGARIQGKEYILGNRNLLQQFGVTPGDTDPHKTYLLEQNERSYQIVAAVDLQDSLRDDTALTVQQFKNRGLKVLLFTGADKLSAEKYAQALPGIDGIYADLGDGQAKANKVKELQAQGRRMLMLGDGVNDALAMQEAHASMAMKHAHSDEGAHYVAKARILNGKILAAVDALDISTQAMWRIKFNLSLSLIYNLAIVLLTNTLVLAMGIVLHPGFCAALMVLQVGLIILSSYQFKRQSLPTKGLVSNMSLFQPPRVTAAPASASRSFVPS